MGNVMNLDVYRKQKQRADYENRLALLKEISKINTELIESKFTETEKVNYRFIEMCKNEEIEKLKDVSARINEEARKIIKKWKKEGFFFD